MDKTVLIGGGSGGIGRAIARELAEDGWNVALTYRSNPVGAESAAEDVRRRGRSASVHKVDLSDSVAVGDLVTEIAGGETLGGVVYAAGPHFGMRYVSATAPSYLGEILDVDAKACFNLLQPSIEPLRATKGSIIAVSTPAVRRYAKRDFLSSAPKAVVEASIRAIASEEGRFGIRANCIQVGLLEGEGMWDRLIDSGDYTPRVLEIAKSNIALGHFGDVTDIAMAARFLMSPRARWITGQVLGVDGGFAI
ncbi:SDR family NAD(P)-dependent oxidoreductase [Rhodococcus erythropolis]|uniref:SDR family NAD(P)-dependent oxidoreductase n=1 Tax=Rhodococcus erythropolis TaxID=1833 RepID=UPI002227EF9D|nr:SDR family oxidoreductase [Rhodococcus erythropolis]MCW2295441.1 NAD(P)-dependent dehydrogenase (short-subunit alcohol dehydrogenase family) [Rhodococcus erythropolis]